MKKSYFLAVCFIVITCITAIAQPTYTLIEKITAQEGKLVIPHAKWKLANGLIVIIHEDHSDPIVHTQVTYKVGSNRETPGKTGFAHFFEHMMFQGSKNLRDEEHFKIISDAGGNGNGFTARDKTVYFENMPSNQLEMALYLESDRMGFMLDSLTNKKFENQRDAVKNEKSQNQENIPYAMGFGEKMNQFLYPFKHPYSWEPIGYVDDLNKATVEDAKSFFLRWYGPNNAILTIAGDVKSEVVMPLVDKYFGTLKPCPEVKKLRVPTFTLPIDKYTSYKDNIYSPLNLRVYPTVPNTHKDEPALTLLSFMMGQGKQSILYKNFVKSKIAFEAFMFHRADDLSGEFTMGILISPPENMNLETKFTEIDAKVKATINEFETVGITDEALQSGKSIIESQKQTALTSLEGKAMELSETERLLGKDFSIADDIERYNKVTKEDILRVFNKYIKGAGAAILNTYPIFDEKDSVKSINPYANFPLEANPEYVGLKHTPNPDKFDRSIKPKAGEPKTVTMPATYKTTLANGLKVMGTKYNESQIVNIYMNISGGDMVLPADKLKKRGLANVTASMMDESTKNYTAEKIETALFNLGSFINFNASDDVISIDITCLKKNIDATLRLLEEKLFNPAFNEEDLKIVIKSIKEGINSESKEPNAIGQKLFNKVLYGNTVLGTKPTISTLDNIKIEDVKSYYDSYFSPSVTNLVIVGDLDEQEAFKKLEFLNKWQAKPVVINPIVLPEITNEPQIFIFDKVTKSTIVNQGFISEKYSVTGEYFKNQIANYIFGGTFNTRLNLNLREDKGYTYGIRSTVKGDNHSGIFMIGAAIKRTSSFDALFEINKEFVKYNKDGITDDELTFTKNAMLNGDALKYETPGQKAKFLLHMLEYNLDANYVAQQQQILKNITKEELNVQIKKLFDTNKLKTVIIGDKSRIESQMEKLIKKEPNSEFIKKFKMKKISL